MISRTFGRLLISYLTVTEALHVLWTGSFSGAPETIVKALIVPALQTALLEGARVVIHSVGSSADDRLARFFGRWLMLAVTLAAASPTIDYVMAGRVDLTVTKWLTLLVTPAIQAAGLGDPATGRAPSTRVWQTVWRHPLVTPVMLLDAVMFVAGWVLASHALVGTADAAILQRRWMGTKLLAAAVAFSLWPARDHQARVGQGRHRPLGLALTLAAIALPLFAPATLAAAARGLATVTAQPAAIVLLEIYASTMLMVVWAAVAFRRTIADPDPVAHTLIGWATLALFVATLALLMNGFVSAQAVRPWAGLAVMSGSLAATVFFAAALVRGRPVHRG